MEAVKFLVAVEAIDLLWRQDFLEPSLKDFGAGDWPSVPCMSPRAR